MTVNTATATASYSGNGATQVFAVPFYFLVDTDLKVSKRTAATGVTSVLTLNSDYTLSGAGNNAGGFLTALAAPLSGDQLFIERNVVAVQQTAYPENNKFPSASHEKALDRLTMLCQQFLAKVTFGLFRDPLGNTFDLGNGTLLNSGTAVNGTDVPNLAQVQALAASVSTGILPGLIATYTDLISTLAGKGSSLVSFLQAGTSAVARTVLGKLQDTVCVFDFMTSAQIADVKANTTTLDVTTALQAAINYGITVGKSVFLPSGTYKISNTLTINASVSLIGEGWQPYTASATVNTPGFGSWILVTHTGTPGILVTKIAGGRTSGVALKNFAMKWVHAAPGVGWTPTVYDWAIKVVSADDTTVEDVLLFNPYKGIQITGTTTDPAGRLNLSRVYGQPLSVGVDLDFSVDVSSLIRVHFWPFWSSDTNVMAWMKANSATFLSSKRNDNTSICDIFGYGYRYGILIGSNTFGTTSRIRGANIDFDDSVRAFWVAVGAAGSSGSFSNFHATANPATTNADMFVSEADGVDYSFSNLRLSNSQQSTLLISGNNPQFRVSGFWADQWNIGGGANPAISVASTGRVSVNNSKFTQANSGPIRGGAGIVSVDEWIAYTCTVTAQTGALTTVSTNFAKYRRIGNTVQIAVEINLTTNGTGATAIIATLPFVAVSAAVIVGRERNTIGKGVCGQIQPAGSQMTITNSADNTYPGASLAIITMSGSYEAQ